MPQTASARAANGLVDLLVVDPAASDYLHVLRGSYRVITTSSADVALEQLARFEPAAIVTELSLSDGSALDVCERARRLASFSALLVITSEPERVPDALVAGCDSVLLKPFAPNLLSSRLARMLRLHLRAAALPQRVHRQLANAAALIARTDRLEAGCTVWPSTHCPYCDHKGITSFEYASHRRAWYACLACKKVWIAKRPD
jgi:DNA-binding response OmpR family regulator